MFYFRGVWGRGICRSGRRQINGQTGNTKKPTTRKKHVRSVSVSLFVQSESSPVRQSGLVTCVRGARREAKRGEDCETRLFIFHFDRRCPLVLTRNCPIIPSKRIEFGLRVVCRQLNLFLAGLTHFFRQHQKKKQHCPPLYFYFAFFYAFPCDISDISRILRYLSICTCSRTWWL